ncbi:MAG: hypothetical protein ACD_50C00309G0004 [uncultured bacterium]|nr:MAG: hypothetical protein ACD_50C00309G0004 [uncultured bacterium]OGH13173.1 MAG: hypothetical protein A2687_05310 [Candidatus Levybacteria bacterium RIFCSPHIGHO2_01_FULL_38_26]
MKSTKTFLLYFKFPIGRLDSDNAFDLLMDFEDILREIVESSYVPCLPGSYVLKDADREKYIFI